MRRTLVVLLPLAMAGLACSLLGLPGSGAQATPDAVGTVVAATLTAIGPKAGGPTATEVPAATGVPPAETAAPTPTPPGVACSLAYADGNNLYCLGEGDTPVQIAAGEGPLSDPKISPDGQRVAYLVRSADETNQLWVAAADGSDSRRLVGPGAASSGDPNVIDFPLQFEWQAGTHTIFFNTQFAELSGIGGPGERINADLWKVDADTGSLGLVMARGSVGLFRLSPDGRHIALSLPESIDLVQADGTGFQHLLDFPFVITYSEYAYKPPVTWSPDSTFFNVAIPSADPLAADTHVSFYRFGVDGSVQQWGRLPGNFVFGDSRPAISPDGQHAFYGRVDDAAQSTSLHILDAGGADTPVAQVDGVAVSGLGWSPDSQRFAYATRPDGAASVVTPGGGIQPIAPGAQVMDLKWKDTGALIFYGKVNGQWGLHVQRLGEGPRALVDGLGESVTFDVRP